MPFAGRSRRQAISRGKRHAAPASARQKSGSPVNVDVRPTNQIFRVCTLSMRAPRTSTLSASEHVTRREMDRYADRMPPVSDLLTTWSPCPALWRDSHAYRKAGSASPSFCLTSAALGHG